MHEEKKKSIVKEIPHKLPYIPEKANDQIKAKSYGMKCKKFIEVLQKNPEGDE